MVKTLLSPEGCTLCVIKSPLSYCYSRDRRGRLSAARIWERGTHGRIGPPGLPVEKKPRWLFKPVARVHSLAGTARVFSKNMLAYLICRARARPESVKVEPPLHYLHRNIRPSIVFSKSIAVGVSGRGGGTAGPRPPSHASNRPPTVFPLPLSPPPG